MNTLGKFVLAVLVLAILINMIESCAEHYSQLDTQVRSQEVKMVEPHQAQVRSPQEIARAPQELPYTNEMSHTHQMDQEMGQEYAHGQKYASEQNLGAQDQEHQEYQPVAIEDVVGTLESSFAESAPVPTCEEALGKGNLFCQTTNSTSCGSATDDFQARRNYPEMINKIRTDRGEKWNNFSEMSS